MQSEKELKEHVEMAIDLQNRSPMRHIFFPELTKVDSQTHKKQEASMAAAKSTDHRAKHFFGKSRLNSETRKKTTHVNKLKKTIEDIVK